MAPYLHGLHDPGGESHMRSAPGWIVFAVSLTELGRMDFSAWKAQGYGVIVRLNWSFGQGTIPTPDKYETFAKMCADFVRLSPGVDWVQIANEPNHKQEWPGGQKIEAVQAAKCFNLCYEAIKQVRPSCLVMTPAMAPWNNQAGEWTEYYPEMLQAIIKTDGFGLHAYTHGSDPGLITSNQMVNGWVWNFRVYQEQLLLIPSRFDVALPAFITECDQGDVGWADINSGYIVGALSEINAWNQAGGHRQILCLAFYRWQKQPSDIWWIEGKNGVIQDFENGVNMRFQVPGQQVPPAPQPDPGAPQPPRPVPEPEKDYLEVWDPRLEVRYTRLGVVVANRGEQAWHVTQGKWYDVQEAGGRTNVFVSVLDEQGELISGVPVRFFWQDGQDVKKTESKYDPFLGGKYSLDFGPMQATAPAYGLQIVDGKPTDIVDGLGLGSIEAPKYKEHTCYWFKFQLFREKSTPVVTPPPVIQPVPVPPVVVGSLTHPLPGGVISQHFYQDPASYAQFGLIGHNGTDIAGRAEGTPILSIADGVVAFTGTDKDYGNYVRVSHPQFNIYSFYAHCESISVTVGQAVKAGQELAKLGHTGNVSPAGPAGAHLHLEIRRMSPGGAYNLLAPMQNGRVDPETWACLFGLKL